MKTSESKNYYYELFRKKYHTSEIVRSQIAAIKEKIENGVMSEPLKMVSVTFRGQVVKTSFEKTLKIISRLLFLKGKFFDYNTISESGLVEAYFVATETEIEELIRYLMKRHVVLHLKKAISKDASNLLIIDEKEKKKLGDFQPDKVHCNYVTGAEVCEKYTGRLGDFLIDNGIPLSAETLGSELRFNIIETKNKVYTSAGLKEIFLHMQFITLVLILDLEQHYFKYRIFCAQEDDLKAVEENIDNLGLFTELFERIGDEANPLLYNNDLFVDLIRLEHIIEKGNWKSLPAYDSYVYSASKSLDSHLEFLEEFGLFLTYADGVEKSSEKLEEKLLKRSSDVKDELGALDANYHEFRNLKLISHHPVLRDDFQELLTSLVNLQEYVDSLSSQNAEAGDTEGIKERKSVPKKKTKGFLETVRNYTKSILASAPDSSQKDSSQKEEAMIKKQGDEVRKLLAQVKEPLRNISELKTTSGVSAYLDAKKNVPFLTNLSVALKELKKLITDIERGKDIQEQFRSIFDRKNKFVSFFNELTKSVQFKTKREEKSIQGILHDLQKLLHDKPLKADKYKQIVDTINKLEGSIAKKSAPTQKKSEAAQSIPKELSQNETYRNIMNIRAGIQNILQKEKEIRGTKTFKDEPEFLSLSEKELDVYLEELVAFYKELKDTKYFGKISNFKETESKFDQLIEKVNDIEHRISSKERGKNNTISGASAPRIDFLKASMVTRKNLEDTILLVQRQISQALNFIQTIKDFLDQHSFVHSGVSSSVLFDQITFLLSNTDVRALDLTKLTEDMYNESVNIIFQYQVGETFAEPKKAEIKNLMKKIEKRAVVKTYGNKN
ncbi:MAG: hypothetical protein D8M57_08310 [Candidatus Scalindua sp. AMX11]|nr:MAG: hypothetical protein DWQ00_05165 [Candidatus Scalindua sp.]NOG84345.1 hypothetical protein [Planctomycetota bacterium]RZV74426.1 MAG: hypothetical protein EX341_13050 [Candidatus Scalindua sp. SCAELEC01]TDE65346.1 MAG: hypothetical protein D8M57_08310 [Candidatus Scalindua sp. AMX11]GJQ60829.1 MAG: hypothetical protein SCALA701_36300 [Candidatus Scalindua sp.]